MTIWNVIFLTYSSVCIEIKFIAGGDEVERFTAAVLQLAPIHMNPDANMDKAEKMIGECVGMCGARLIVLPESFTTGFTPKGTRADLWNVVSEIPGRLTDRGIEIAKKHNVYLVFPTYERGPGGIVYNSAALLGPEGLLGVYRKTHPFPTERLTDAGGWTTPGTEPCCIDTPIGKIGMVVCYDGDFPELARVTALMGAEIIVRPSVLMRTSDHWEFTNRARAYDNHVYWIATNCVGLDASGTYCFGDSMIVGPTGVRMAQCRGSEEFAWAELDPDPLKTIHPNISVPQIFDHMEDRNLEAYKTILTAGKSAFEPAQRIPYRR